MIYHTIGCLRREMIAVFRIGQRCFDCTQACPGSQCPSFSSTAGTTDNIIRLGCVAENPTPNKRKRGEKYWLSKREKELEA